MATSITVPPLSAVARLAGTSMVPLMYVLAGTVWEAPQRTHFWNNKKLAPEETAHLDGFCMVGIEGSPGACSPLLFGLFPRFHTPIFGGWRDFVALQPTVPVSTWHIGWCGVDNGGGVSRIPLRGPVRMLIGPGPVSFFGVTSSGGEQIPIEKLGFGRIGLAGDYAAIPLL